MFKNTVEKVMDGCIILDQAFLDEELLKYTYKNLYWTGASR